MKTKASKTKRRGPGRPSEETDLRAKLLAEARRLFSENGFEKTSTREIASAAGANIGLISYYFGSKDDLYLAVMQESAEQLGSNEVFSLSLEGMDREGYRSLMRSLIALHLGSLMADPELLLLVQRELLDGAPRSRTIINGIMQQMLGQLVSLIQEGKRLGFVRPEVHEVTFLLVLSRAIVGYYFLHRQLQGKVKVVDQMLPPETEEAIDQLFLMFFDGVLL